MQRYSLGVTVTDRWPVGHLVPDPNGHVVLFADIPLQPVPEPLPWLDQPDGEGWWKVRNKLDLSDWWIIKVFESIGKNLLWEEVGDETIYDFNNADGILDPGDLANLEYQRIPQPILPGEGETQ